MAADVAGSSLALPSEHFQASLRLQLHFLRKQTEEATGMPGPADGKDHQTEREARR